ncbi:DUF4365 domain-containing protein [Pedobacter panaciterrae]|uniref:DUF4365 domain-containing protein n=1 Tax=Pedobacter panaciterrae TaxID=363849 RepID=UPI00155DC9B4|nr:DUF4365 domain-containing protein [Pedobacter panaciterrae]NQX56681.1 DUF4365 domain-containing protein [Pedobacter panaciterrae]
MDYRSVLPKSNPNEDLETISRNKFVLLLDTTLFEVRQEVQRDKGVDLVIEIKEKGHYTNFRFIVQLKATTTGRVKKDASLSYGIEVSNINYLLNYGMPAYYVLYDHRNGHFYVAQANEVFQSLINKYKTLALPATYSYSFCRSLDRQVVDDIYKYTLDSGLLIRRLNAHRNAKGGKVPGGAGIMIDEDNEVYGVEQNLSFIEQCGFRLLNDYAFQQIIEIEQRTYLGGKEAPPMFNYVCGMAYFQKGELLKALDYLKKADRKAAAFQPDQQAILTHILLQATYLLEMMDRETYDQKNKELLAGEKLGSFLEIERAVQEFYHGEGTYADKIQTLYQTVNDIVSAEPDNLGGKITTYSKILHIEMGLLTKDFIENLSTLHWYNCGHLQSELYLYWAVLQEKYAARSKMVLNYAARSSNVPAMANVIMDYMEWLYKTAYIKQFFNNWNSNTRRSPKITSPEVIADLIEKSGALEELYSDCANISLSEAQVLCLILKYQIEDFCGQKELAEKTLKRLEELVEEKELRHSRLEDYKALFKGETEHQAFHLDREMRMGHFYTVVSNSGIDMGFLNELTSKSLTDFEHRLKWSVVEFMEFDLPEIKQ